MNEGSNYIIVVVVFSEMLILLSQGFWVPLLISVLFCENLKSEIPWGFCILIKGSNLKGPLEGGLGWIVELWVMQIVNAIIFSLFKQEL